MNQTGVNLIFLLIVLCSISQRVHGQNMDDIEILFRQQRYDAVIKTATELIVKEPGNALAYQLAGTAYTDLSKYDSGVIFLQKAIQLDNDSTYISGWAHARIGYACLYLGEREKAIKELTRSLTMGTTEHLIKFSKHVLDSIGYQVPERKYPKNYLPDWVVMKGTHITYKFQDTNGISNIVWVFISKHEAAYEQLSKIFEPKLPAKPVMHVWNDREIAHEILHKQLGFANPPNCFCHLYRNQTVGHEMAHILSYWSWGAPNSGASRFINEGIGVCFDLEGNDKYAAARRMIGKERIKSVLDIWENEKKYDADLLYPVAGAFVAYLQKNSTVEEFKKVVKLQTLDEVKVLYGEKFNKLITDFNLLMGVK